VSSLIRYISFRSKTDAPLSYHSCGSIVPMIPHLIDVGINALHPVQPIAAGMGGGEGEREWLKKEYEGVPPENVLAPTTPRMSMAGTENPGWR
jgi:hypothetical protein